MALSLMYCTTCECVLESPVQLNLSVIAFWWWSCAHSCKALPTPTTTLWLEDNNRSAFIAATDYCILVRRAKSGWFIVHTVCHPITEYYWLSGNGQKSKQDFRGFLMMGQAGVRWGGLKAVMWQTVVNSVLPFLQGQKTKTAAQSPSIKVHGMKNSSKICSHAPAFGIH